MNLRSAALAHTGHAARNAAGSSQRSMPCPQVSARSSITSTRADSARATTGPGAGQGMVGASPWARWNQREPAAGNGTAATSFFHVNAGQTAASNHHVE